MFTVTLKQPFCHLPQLSSSKSVNLWRRKAHAPTHVLHRCMDSTRPNTVKYFSETPRHACHTLFFPETCSDFARWDVHEIWHIRNNWNQAKACRAIAQPCSSGPRGADIFRTAIRIRPQEGTLEGNKPLNRGDVELGNAICLWMMAAD